MARQDLSDLTPAEVKAYKNKQARNRMAKMRAVKKEEREMAKKKELLTENSPEAAEFIDDLRGLKFTDMIELIAAWERRYQQLLPIGSSVVAIPGETHAEYHQRFEHHRQMALATFYSQDFYVRQKAKERKKVFDAKEAAEAKRLGITVFDLQKRRKIAAATEAKKAREIQRLASKQAA